MRYRQPHAPRFILHPSAFILPHRFPKIPQNRANAKITPKIPPSLPRARRRETNPPRPQYESPHAGAQRRERASDPAPPRIRPPTETPTRQKRTHFPRKRATRRNTAPHFSRRRESNPTRPPLASFRLHRS